MQRHPPTGIAHKCRVNKVNFTVDNVHTCAQEPSQQSATTSESPPPLHPAAPPSPSGSLAVSPVHTKCAHKGVKPSSLHTPVHTKCAHKGIQTQLTAHTLPCKQAYLHVPSTPHAFACIPLRTTLYLLARSTSSAQCLQQPACSALPSPQAASGGAVTPGGFPGKCTR